MAKERTSFTLRPSITSLFLIFTYWCIGAIDYNLSPQAAASRATARSALAMSSTKTEASSDDNDAEVFDLLIVGGGVVGLAILRAAALEGWKCALVEQEPDLLSWASGSNSGIACTGVDASPGSLERALIRDSAAQIRLFCKEMNIPTRACGSLVCQWPWDFQDGLEKVLLESHDAGDTHAARLSSDELQALEANLNKSAVGAVHIPGEIVVDPWLYSIALAVHARENGAILITNFGMDPIASSWNGELWTVVRKANDLDNYTGPSNIRAKAVVSATGLWSDLIQQKVHSSSTWNARPRRGQYRIFSSNDSTRIAHPIQPVPTQRTKGVFVFSSLYDHIIVGPTALDQESRTDRDVDTEVADELANVVRRILPDLDIAQAHVGEYVGIRPGTDKRDYQIHVDYPKRWIAAAGIRSTGLTASLGIGRHVTHMLRGLLPEPTSPLKSLQTTPLPPVKDLVEDFHSRGDEKVEIQGHAYKVTHPITKLGWQKRSGIASQYSTIAY